jgi:hypothetical protein
MQRSILARHALQVEVVEPRACDELTKQLGHHLGVVEQAVIQAIVVAHASLSSTAGRWRWRRHLATRLFSGDR